LKVGPHKYIDNGHYLTAKSNDGHYGIRFETEDGKITAYYVGRFDAIQTVARCQQETNLRFHGGLVFPQPTSFFVRLFV
jgi:hypothetical protein